jgi:hypothetical protein
MGSVNRDIIETRLARHNRRNSAALRRLAEVGHLDEVDLAAILTASELTGEPDKVLAHAVSYFALKAKGVSIADTIRMAGHQNRRLNMGWTPRRFAEEHDRLARAETLARLAAENTVFDLTAYEQALPRRFPGYLIRTSRRLGMEGLRQRHCVASYARRVAAGSCAIAVVFLDRKRWTVELIGRADPKTGEVRLSLSQVQSRLGQRADQETRERIAEVLGVDLQTPAIARRAPASQAYRAQMRAVLAALREHGVEGVSVDFEGSGDSGAIENIEMHPMERDCNEAEFTGVCMEVEIGTDGPRQRWRECRMTIEEGIKEAVYGYLEETNVNWYDNEGGYGEAYIDVAAGEVSISVNCRVIESENEFDSTFDIESGEVIEE